MKRQGDSSYDYREERAKERYYEEKYSKIDAVEATEVKSTTLFESLAEAFKPSLNIDKP